MGAETVCDCAACCLHKECSALILVIKWKLLDLNRKPEYISVKIGGSSKVARR
jgi:hypothetical protein